MTAPAQQTIDREQQKLYVTDAELIRWLGVPEAEFRRLLPGLESKYGFPKKSPLFSGRRYRPAVKAWLDKHHGVNMEPPKGRHS